MGTALGDGETAAANDWASVRGGDTLPTVAGTALAVARVSDVAAAVVVLRVKSAVAGAKRVGIEVGTGTLANGEGVVVDGEVRTATLASGEGLDVDAEATLVDEAGEVWVAEKGTLVVGEGGALGATALGGVAGPCSPVSFFTANLVATCILIYCHSQPI